MIFPSVYTLDTFPHYYIRLQTNPTQYQHVFHTRRTLHHVPHTPWPGVWRAQGAKGY